MCSGRVCGGWSRRGWRRWSDHLNPRAESTLLGTTLFRPRNGQVSPPFACPAETSRLPVLLTFGPLFLARIPLSPSSLNTRLCHRRVCFSSVLVDILRPERSYTRLIPTFVLRSYTRFTVCRSHFASSHPSFESLIPSAISRSLLQLWLLPLS